MVRNAQAERGSRFPVYNSVKEALCFKCGEPFTKVTTASGYAKGHGAYQGDCQGCHYVTWFDVEPIDGHPWERIDNRPKDPRSQP